MTSPGLFIGRSLFRRLLLERSLRVPVSQRVAVEACHAAIRKLYGDSATERQEDDSTLLKAVVWADMSFTKGFYFAVYMRVSPSHDGSQITLTSWFSNPGTFSADVKMRRGVAMDQIVAFVRSRTASSSNPPNAG